MTPADLLAALSQVKTFEEYNQLTQPTTKAPEEPEGSERYPPEWWAEHYGTKFDSIRREQHENQ